MKPRPSVSEDARILTSGIPSPKPGTGWIASAELVGRDAVLAALDDPGRVCTIIFGEPGIGKTRLLTESQRRASIETFAVSCVPVSTPIPFDPLVALTRSLERVGRLRSSQVEAVRLSPEADRLSYFRDALAGAAERGPLGLQIDDVHVADEKSLEAIRYCATRLSDLPIHWLLAGRRTNPRVIDLAAALERSELARVINLSGLTPSDLKMLAARLRPDAELSDAVVIDLHRRTGGNPLYAELLIVAPLVGEDSASSDLRRLLHERLAALSVEALNVASWISVNVESLSHIELEIMSDRSQGQVARALAELTNESIVVERDQRYSFRHDLLREACYLMLDEDSRTRMHATLARYCKNEWKRASHLDGAHRFEEAAQVFVQIGWDCLERQAPHEAFQAFEKSLERIARDSRIATEAVGGKGAALAQLGLDGEAKSAMDAFEARADQLAPATRVKVRTACAECVWDAMDDDAAALPFVEEALREAQESVPSYVPRLLYVLGSFEERRANLDKAGKLLQDGITLAQGSQYRALRIRLEGCLGVVLARRGKVQEALTVLEAAAASALSCNLSNELARCCARLCYVSHMASDSTRYEHWCRVGLEADGPKPKAIEALLRSNLATVAIDRGQLREALGLVLTAQDSMELSKPTLQRRIFCVQVQLYAMLGDFQSVDRVLSDARKLDQTAATTNALGFCAGFAAELRDDPEQASLHYHGVISRVGSNDFSEDFQIRALSGFARIEAMRGNVDAAQRAVDGLEMLATRDWPIAHRSLREAQGCLALACGSNSGVEKILSAATDCEYPFWRAHLQVIAANATGDRELFLNAIEAFDSMGAEYAADRARSLARTHGLRPGRKREIQGALSSRESSVAFLIAGGKTNAEIGEILHISSRTVEYHVGNILSKCGLRSRIDIARMLAAGRSLGPPAEP
jgi:DNA-binding CsgD family transcriptional regulator/tetratricopeptide (TPR) repeat protein